MFKDFRDKGERMKDENKEPKANAIYVKREKEHEDAFNRIKQLIPSPQEGKKEKNLTEDEIAEFIKTAFQLLVGFDKFKMMDFILDSKYRLNPKSDNDGWISEDADQLRHVLQLIQNAIEDKNEVGRLKDAWNLLSDFLTRFESPKPLTGEIK
jgi:hypothetical protein